MINRSGNNGNSDRLFFLGSKITADVDCSHEINRSSLLGRNLDSILKSRDITLPTKVHIVKAMVFPAVMYECESWTIRKAVSKNWHFQTVVLEKTLESPLESKPFNPKLGNQPWIIIGRTGAETEASKLWPPDVKSLLTGKDPDAGKVWGREEKGVTEDEMVGWHHRLNGYYEFEQTLGDNEGQGGLVCYCSQCHRVRHNYVTDM